MSQERLKVLLIEHDPGFTQQVGEMLGQASELGAEVQPRPDLTSGLSALRENKFDLVMLDMSIPDGAGLANVSLLQAQAPHLPIIVAGDADDERVALEAVHAGAQDYLVKSQLNSGWLERSIRYAIERHRMDLSLMQAEEKYHGVFDHLVEGIFRTTPEGQYLMANAALARIYGYNSPEELIAGLTDISRRLYVQEGRRAEFVRLMQEHDTITDFESQVHRKDGEVIWISENCRAVRDEQGQLLYYEGTVEDITQQRKAEERRHLAEDKLRHSEALYHSLVETLPQNIFRKDTQGRFTFGNQQFCKVLGRSLDEILGKTDFDFFPQALAAKYQLDDQRVLETGEPYDTVEEHQPPGSDKIYVQVVKTPLRGPDGKVIGLQGIFWDITEQRLAEERIRRMNTLLEKSRAELKERNTQMEDDLKMAREIQLNMLPQQYPVFPRAGFESESAFQFTHRYLPTGSVGGDFFSISSLSESEACVFICDVAGHGVRSALVTAMIRALVEELKLVATNPGQFMTKLNRDLCSILKHRDSPMLTTAFYLVADWRAGLMRYANAGHPRPLHVRRCENRVEPLANASGKGQPALGLFPEALYQSSEMKLEPNDLVMLFTDGIYEVQGPKGELFSQKQLIARIERRIHSSAPELFDQLLAEVSEFSAGAGFTDDVCLVGMETTR